MVLKCFLCSTEIGFTWVVDQIASADFLIKLNKEKREKEEKKESQWLHLSYLIKVPAEINIEKSSVLAFFLLNLIFGWCVTLVSTSRAAASTSTMSPKHLRRSFQHLRACQIFISQRTFFVYQNINVIKVQRKAHMHPRMLSPFGYICMTARPTFIPFGSAELSSGLEIVPGPCRPSMSTWTTDERLLGAGGKNVSHMCRPPTLISSFREMMWWENYLASSNSEHTRQKAALVFERGLDATVVLLKLRENTPLDSQSHVKFAWIWFMVVSPENLKLLGFCCWC